MTYSGTALQKRHKREILRTAHVRRPKDREEILSRQKFSIGAKEYEGSQSFHLPAVNFVSATALTSSKSRPRWSTQDVFDRWRTVGVWPTQLGMTEVASKPGQDASRKEGRIPERDIEVKDERVNPHPWEATQILRKTGICHLGLMQFHLSLKNQESQLTPSSTYIRQLLYPTPDSWGKNDCMYRSLSVCTSFFLSSSQLIFNILAPSPTFIRSQERRANLDWFPFLFVTISGKMCYWDVSFTILSLCTQRWMFKWEILLCSYPVTSMYLSV